MLVGIEKFVPARLQIARSARALRQKELAELVGRVDATISKWESDEYEQKPDAIALARLAEILDVEISWFFKPVQKQATASFFRSMKSELGKMRDKANARLSFVEEIEFSLSEYVEFPEVDIPDIMNGVDFREIRDSDIERCAMHLRDYWQIGDGPIEDLLLVIENSGVIVAHDEIGSSKLDGISRWCENGRPYMLLAKDKNVGVRRRFDAAHELGHIVLHRKVNSEDLKNNFHLIEEQAMAFAGAFLMPESAFSDDVYSLSLDALASIKSKWKVAIAAMIKRLSSIGKISPEYERRLWQYYSYRKWRGFEPLDDEISIENPYNLKSSIEMVINDGVLSKENFVRKVGISAVDIENLSGLRDGYFSAQNKGVARMEPVPRTSHKPLSGGGEVVSLEERRKKK